MVVQKKTRKKLNRGDPTCCLNKWFDRGTIETFNGIPKNLQMSSERIVGQWSLPWISGLIEEFLMAGRMSREAQK